MRSFQWLQVKFLWKFLEVSLAWEIFPTWPGEEFVPFSKENLRSQEFSKAKLSKIDRRKVGAQKKKLHS